MDPERLREIDGYLDQLWDVPVGKRAALLAEICGDGETRERVLAMLARAEGVGERLAAAIGSAAEEMAEVPARERVGPYRLVREIGAGGMGAVWLAERADGEYEQRVAIKLIRSALAGGAMRERFLNERQILAGLRHPNIAQLLDGGTTEDGAPYLVMEYVEGKTLGKHAEGLREGEKLGLFLKVCEAVEYAHRNLVVHRDLKMSNVLVTANGDVKLLDFGIAKVVEGGVDGGATRWMTPEFASPEQVLGRPVTTLSDVYSLGAVLWVLLAGKSPYRTEAGGAAEMVEAVARQDVAGPLGNRGDLDVIVLNAMRKEPERRYQTVAEMAADVRAYLEGRPIGARPDTASYRIRRFVGRHPWGAAGAAAVALLVVGFLLVLLIQAKRLEAERDAARRERDNAQWLSQFLVGIFKVADPRGGAGERTTARELLERGAQRLAGERQRDELRALVGTTIGRAYYGLGLLGPAEKAAKEAYEAAKVAGDGQARMEALTVLEEVYLELAKPEELMKYGQEHEASAGLGDSREKAMGIAAQGSAWDLRRDFRKAEERQREALAMLTRIGQGESPEAGVVMNNAATAAYNSGARRHAEAGQMAKRAVEILRKTGQAEQLMNGLNSVAVVAMSTDDFVTAEPAALEGLALARKMYGDRHLNIGFNYNNLCGMYTLMKRVEKGLPYCRQAVEIRKEGYPAGHRLIGISLNNWGKALLAAGRWEEAEKVYREAYPILGRENGGPAARAAEGIGYALEGKRDWAGSARYLREAVRRWEQIGTKNLGDLRERLSVVEKRR